MSVRGLGAKALVTKTTPSQTLRFARHRISWRPSSCDRSHAYLVICAITITPQIAQPTLLVMNSELAKRCDKSDGGGIGGRCVRPFELPGVEGPASLNKSYADTPGLHESRARAANSSTLAGSGRSSFRNMDAWSLGP
jgi:hypothetical protein